MFVMVNRKAPPDKTNSPRAKNRLHVDSGGTKAVAMTTPTKAILNLGEITT